MLKPCYLLNSYYRDPFEKPLVIYDVPIDESDELQRLVVEAHQLRPLPFDQKLDAVRKLAQQAMKNAYEGWQTKTNPPEEVERCRQIVCFPSPLSNALKQKLGCCRFQSVLFFILGYEAELGDAHFIQRYPIGGGVKTCYNEIISIKENLSHLKGLPIIASKNSTFPKPIFLIRFFRYSIKLPCNHLLHLTHCPCTLSRLNLKLEWWPADR